MFVKVRKDFEDLLLMRSRVACCVAHSDSLQQSSGDQRLTISLCKNLPILAKQFVNQQGGQFGRNLQTSRQIWLRLSSGEFCVLVLLPLDDCNYLDNKSVTLGRKLFDILCLSCPAHYFGLITPCI